MSAVDGTPVEEERATESSGYCRDCGGYGRGRFDDIRTAHTDWIVDHIGCPGPPEE